MTQKLRKSLRKLNKEKQDKPVLYSGELGVPLNGTKTVEVPNRKGFVFVRLKGNTSELIQAHNAVVSPVYGLPVLVGRQGNIYQIIGHNIDRYQGVANTPYLPKHGPQHSFNHNLGIGGDIVWVYSQQFMPLLSYPSGTNGSMSLALEPSFYEWNGTWRYAQNTGTPSYTPYLPTITGSARMVLSYIDPSDNSIKLVAGTPFDGSLTGSAQISQYIPDIPRSIGVPLAAVRLVTGTTSIGWDAIYDMRDFYTVSPFTPTGSITDIDTIGFAGLDEGVPIGTGTMLNVTGDLSLTRSGTMFNLNYVSTPVGGGGGAGVMAWDEGAPLGTGTIFNFTGGGVIASLSGSIVNVDVPAPGMAFIQEIQPVGTPTGTFSNIPQAYRHLKIIFAARSTAVATSTSMNMFYNQDYTAANYRRTADYGFGVSTAGADGAADANIAPGFIDAASSPTGSYSMGEISIPYYAKTHFNKEAFVVGTHRRDASSVFVLAYNSSQEWFAQQSAVDRIDLVLLAGNYVTGSFISLYGVL